MMPGTRTPAKLPLEAWARLRLKQLRDQASALEQLLADYESGVEPDEDIRGLAEQNLPLSLLSGPMPSLPLRPKKTEAAGKYAPLIAAWESTPSTGMSHPEIFALAQKTMPNVGNQNAVRTFVFSLKRGGKVVERDGLLFIKTKSAHKAASHSHS